MKGLFPVLLCIIFGVVLLMPQSRTVPSDGGTDHGDRELSPGALAVEATIGGVLSEWAGITRQLGADIRSGKVKSCRDANKLLVQETSKPALKALQALEGYMQQTAGDDTAKAADSFDELAAGFEDLARRAKP